MKKIITKKNKKAEMTQKTKKMNGSFFKGFHNHDCLVS